jgi:prepilin-type N-terminal cleavage/methylation domain-containing protein
VTLSNRVRDEAGFGLVELLIAMTVMAIGISAIVAGMSSGFIAVNRARDASTAAALADKQMEAYRALPNCSIYLDAGTIPGIGAPSSIPYESQTGVYSATQITDGATLTPPLRSSASPCPTPDAKARNAHQQLLGADGRLYWVDTYMVESTLASTTTGDPIPSGTVARKVTVMVRDPKDPTNTKFLVRETASFAPPTGCTNPFAQQPAGC